MAPIDWSGLLKWSLSYSDGTSKGMKMSKEDAEFLTGAAKEYSKQSEEPRRIIDNAVKSLLVAESEQAALECLEIIEKGIDYYPELVSRYFEKGNFDSLFKAIAFEQEEVVVAALNILSVILSNNFAVQEVAYKEGRLKDLLNKLCSTSQLNLKAKILGSISSLVRHHDVAEKELVQKGIAKSLSEALNSTALKYREKAASLCNHLLNSGKLPYSEITQHALDTAIINALSDRDISSAGVQYGELVVQCTVELIHQHRHQLFKAGRLQQLSLQIDSRLEYLHGLTKEGNFPVEDEIKALDHAKSLCTYLKPRKEGRKASS